MATKHNKDIHHNVFALWKLASYQNLQAHSLHAIMLTYYPIEFEWTLDEIILLSLCNIVFNIFIHFRWLMERFVLFRNLMKQL